MKPLFAMILSMAVLFAGCTPATATLPAQTATAEGSETAALERSSFQYPETGPIIQLNYDPALTGPVEGGLVPAVANSPDQPYFLVHPAYVQLRFPGIGKNQTFQLPFPIEGPQLIVYQTQDFSGYENSGTRSYPQQLDALKALLEKGLDSDHCLKPLAGDEHALPFLPVLNSAQMFCAKAQPLSFEGGKGFRYVTYYSQGIDPAIDWFAVYTFQGLSDDGRFYLSATLPIRTNILPSEPSAPGSEPDISMLGVLLQNQVSQINAQGDDLFTPPLNVLDDLIAGVNIPGE